jgi:DNA-binding NtrC family response regulator
MKKVLIVDDDKELTSELDDLFSDLGFRTEIANTGDEGHLKIQEGTYDVILLDFKMPGFNGIELLQKQKERLLGVKIFLISGSLDMERLINESGIKQLVTYAFAKPFNIESLVGKITEEM